MEEQKASLFLISQVCVQTHADNYLYSSFKLLFFSKIQTKQISLSMTCWLCTTVFFYSINGFKTKGTHGSTYLTFNFKQIQTHIKTFKINASNFSTYIYIYIYIQTKLFTFSKQKLHKTIYLSGHDLLPLDHKQAVAADAVLPRAVLLVAPQNADHPVIPAPGALGRPKPLLFHNLRHLWSAMVASIKNILIWYLKKYYSCNEWFCEQTFNLTSINFYNC